MRGVDYTSASSLKKDITSFQKQQGVAHESVNGEEKEKVWYDCITISKNKKELLKNVLIMGRLIQNNVFFSFLFLIFYCLSMD